MSDQMTVPVKWKVGPRGRGLRALLAGLSPLFPWQAITRQGTLQSKKVLYATCSNRSILHAVT